MPFKDLEKRKQYQKQYTKKYYVEHKDIIKARTKKSNKVYAKRNYDFIKEQKIDKSCAICNVAYPHYVLDFHHVDKNNKSFSISRVSRDPMY